MKKVENKFKKLENERVYPKLKIKQVKTNREMKFPEKNK